MKSILLWDPTIGSEKHLDLINDPKKQKYMIDNLNKMAKRNSVDLIINEIIKLI